MHVSSKNRIKVIFVALGIEGLLVGDSSLVKSLCCVLDCCLVLVQTRKTGIHLNLTKKLLTGT